MPLKSFDRLLASDLANARGWKFVNRHVRNMQPRSEERWLTTRSRIAKMLGTGFLVAVIGSSSRGKTQMAADLMIQTISRGRTAEYTSAVGFFVELRSCYGREAEQHEAQVLNSFCAPRLLIIDEFEKRSDNDWANTLMFEVLNRRLAMSRDTIIISNLNKSEFIKFIGVPLTSRLSGFGGIIECCWQPFL